MTADDVTRQHIFARDSATVNVAGRDQYIRLPPVEPVLESVLPPWGRAPGKLRGRADVVAELDGGHNVVVHGLGGVGKTALALAVARRAERREHLVWWVPATSSADVRAGMLAVAEHLGLSTAEIEQAQRGQRPVRDLVWRCLDASPTRWLLVFDQADDPDVLSGWLRPSNAGSILVTTRFGDPARWGGARLRQLLPLDVDAGADILLDRAPEAGTRAEAADLATRLGGFPLALHLAGHYLAQSGLAGRRTIVDYHRRLDDRFGETVDLGAQIVHEVDARKLVTQTWEVSLSSLDEQGVPEGRVVMRVLSCFAHGVDVPAEFVRPGVFERLSPMDADRLDLVVHRLRALGLLDLTGPDDHRAVAVHPLVQEVNALHRDSEPDRDDVWLSAVVATSLLSHQHDPADPREWDFWRAAWPHYRALVRHVPPSSAYGFRFALDSALPAAAFLIANHRPAQAEELLELMITSAEQTLGTASESYHGALYERGALRDHQGRHAEAAADFRRVRDLMLDAEPRNAYTTVRICTAWNNLAMALHSQGDDATAETELRALLAWSLREGLSGVARLQFRHNLAVVLQSAGQLDRAEAEFHGVLQSAPRDHALRIGAQVQLAHLRGDRGDRTGQVGDLKAALTTAERVLGPDHPRTLHLREDVGLALLDVGKTGEAHRQFQRLHKTVHRLYGADHRVTLAARAMLMATLGDAEVARSELKVVLRDAERALGPDDPLLDTIRAKLAGS